ncbi:uncharacterized protein UV8b_00016 [Ustilaginoidea virens]|uniref:Uncharacterized protein n=1 Tax=Ustilaginoidea virens TaxID=1159556 RepID=A0A8E5HI12_USTVR|nr:uncharacterized protein UV8b_00016 [Ustilaginoidea virens]QUC15775.1 hypothetical protein UV8b_00016 [Ustilaginoidea virens]
MAALSLALAAPTRRGFDLNINNLLRLATNSFADKQIGEAFHNDVLVGSRPAPPRGASPSPLFVTINEYAKRLQNFITKGQDETAANTILKLANSSNDPNYPIDTGYLDSFLERVVAKVDGR